MSKRSITIVFIVMLLVFALSGCIEHPKQMPIDTYNDDGDHFTGTATIDADGNIVSYNIICYMKRQNDEGTRAIGKIYIAKDEQTHIESTSYDLYVDNVNDPMWQISVNGSTPLVKVSGGGSTPFGTLERETYREYPAYMVTYGDGEFEIFAEHIEGFDLI